MDKKNENGGMTDAQHTPESIAEAIRPTLDAFTIAADPYCRKAAEDIYERLLCMTQDYLRENAEWNIGDDIRRCRKIELDNLSLRETNAALLAALEAVEVARNSDKRSDWVRATKLSDTAISRTRNGGE